MSVFLKYFLIKEELHFIGFIFILYTSNLGLRTALSSLLVYALSCFRAPSRHPGPAVLLLGCESLSGHCLEAGALVSGWAIFLKRNKAVFLSQ